MAVFGMPGGAEVFIILLVSLVVFGPTLVIGGGIWLALRRRSKFASPPAPADWYADPIGHHELRYWNGAAWTADVSDNGVQGQDPI